MAYASISVASGHCPCVRRHLNAGITVASAGILTLGLVAAPPDYNDVRIEVRAVRLAALSLPTAEQLGALEKLISNQVQTVDPVTKVATGGAADIPDVFVKAPTAGVTTPPLTIDSTIDPATNPEKVDAAALAATTAALPPIPAPLLPIIGPILLFGPLIVLVILACPPCALFNFLTFAIPSLFIPFAPLSGVALASTAAVEGNATIAPALTSDSLLSDAVPPRVTVTENADDSPQVASIDKRSRTEQVKPTEPAAGSEEVSTETAKDVTETVEAAEESTGPTAVSASERSASDSTSKPEKPAGRPETPRPVVRGSLGAGKQTLDPSRRGNGSRPTTQASADGAATAGSSSAASSSAVSTSTDSGSSGTDSSGGDAGSSE